MTTTSDAEISAHFTDELSRKQFINLYGLGTCPKARHVIPEQIERNPFLLKKGKALLESRPAIIYPQRYLLSLADQPEDQPVSKYLFEKWGKERMNEELYTFEGAKHARYHRSASQEFFALPEYCRPAYSVVQIAQVLSDSPVSVIKSFVKQEGYYLAGAWELITWIEQHGDHFGPQGYTVRFVSLADRGRQHTKTEVEPAYGGGYANHSYRGWLRVRGYAHKLEERPRWKAGSRQATGEDPEVRKVTYFLVSPVHQGGPEEPPEQYIPEWGW